MILCLERPKKSIAGWEVDIMEFIDAHRHQIIADIIHLLDNNSVPDQKPKTRFKTWEKNILFPIVQNETMHDYVIDEQRFRRENADGDMDQGSEIETYIEGKLIDGLYSPQKHFYWIKGTTLRLWILEVIPNFGGRNGQNYKGRLQGLSQQGSLKNLFITSFATFPHHKGTALGNPVRGVLWIPDGQKWDGDSKKIKAVI